MRTRYLIISSVLVFTALVLAACGGTGAPPLSSTDSSTNSSAAASPTAGSADSGSPAASAVDSASTTGLEAQTVEGGSVTVKVTPVLFQMGAPLEFEIAMDTHSVELADDMLQVVVLRDDAGKEYAPLKWDGPGAGGHHREGRIKFALLTSNTKSLTLVVKNMAGVPERLYKWNLAQ